MLMTQAILYNIIPSGPAASWGYAPDRLFFQRKALSSQDMPQATYISVILPLRLEWEPCYSCAFDVAPGDRVRVAFAGKEYVGAVDMIGIEPEAGLVSRGRIKPVIKVEDSLSPVFQEEIALWKAVAEYYMCTVGEVYKAAYPAVKIQSEETQARMDAQAKEKEEARLKDREEKARAKVFRLEERLSRKQEALGKARKDSAKERLEAEAAAISAELDRCRAEIDAAIQSIGRCQEKAEEAPESAIRSKDGAGTGQMEDRTINDGIVLSEAQGRAAGQIREGFREGKPVLLKGVTGSGKTEIYIRLATEALNSGKNVLYLVPEISLSRQLEYRIRKIFGDSLMVFHSGESTAKRRFTAYKVRFGNGWIVLGTRSALFLPLHDLGLVIVDEEHDPSYKQDSPAPRYNGRDTAIMLAGIHRCSILLGSATPSLESEHNCRTGKFALATLEARYHDGEDADIEIIDTIAERKKHGMRGSFSIKLIEHMQETLAAGGQVMLFRSRRSFSPAVQCTECGAIPRCPHCNVSLSLHKGAGNGRLVCHYCGYSTPYTGTCPQCGGEMRGLGAGTQKIEEEAAALFPQARIARLDSDTAQSAVYSKDTIRRFSRGEIDILVGTQMVTKGFDFPDLRLVAVMQADTLLSLQDFRADEKAAQLLEQFRGRCGRRGEKGLFVIQTSVPDHPVYRLLAEGKEQEGDSLLSERKLFGYPPYTRIINIIIKDTVEQRAERMGTKLAGLLESGCPPYMLSGPYSPAVDKVADSFIRIIRLNLRKDRMLAQTKRKIWSAVTAFEENEKYQNHLAIDVDPS